MEQPKENPPNHQNVEKPNEPKVSEPSLLKNKKIESDEDMGMEEEDEQAESNLQKSQPSFMQFAGQQTKKDKLRSLFLRYAEVSDETGIPSMRARQFLKCLQDSGVFDGSAKLLKPKAEIIFSSNTKSKKGFLDFDTFLSGLSKISEIVYPQAAKDKKSQAFELLISNNLFPLQDRLSSQSMELQGSERKGKDMSISTAGLVYDQQVKDFLGSILPILKDIYDIYFGDTFKAAKTYENLVQCASKQLVLFMRDFDLSKSFVPKHMALVMLDVLAHTPDDKLTNSPDVLSVFGDLSQDYGCYFTLSRFFIFLLWVAITGFDLTKPDFEEYTSVEKIYFLLAKMELSNGFLTLYRNVPKSIPVPQSLIPPADLVAQFINNNPLEMRGVKSIYSIQKPGFFYKIIF